MTVSLYPQLCSPRRASHSRGGYQVRTCFCTFSCSPLSYIHIASIRNRLTALKKDRGEFIKAADVNSLYQAVVKQGRPWFLLHI